MLSYSLLSNLFSYVTLRWHPQKPTSPQEGDLFINWGTTGIGETQSIPTIPVASGRDPESELEVPQVFKIEKTEGSSIFGNNTPPPEVVTTPNPYTNSKRWGLSLLSCQIIIQSAQEPVQTITDTPSPVTVTENSLIETGTTSSPLIDIIQDQTPEVAISAPVATPPVNNESTIDPAPTSSNTTNDAIFWKFCWLYDSSGRISKSFSNPSSYSRRSNISPIPYRDSTSSRNADRKSNRTAIEEGIEEKSWATSEKSIFHPTEFIQKSISEIDTMIANIDQKHEKKIIEAEGYKAEKERFTELEKMAYTEAKTMDEERPCIPKFFMKELFSMSFQKTKRKLEKLSRRNHSYGYGSRKYSRTDDGNTEASYKNKTSAA